MNPVLKMYNVIHLKNDKIVITGKGTDKAWAKADILKDFNCFWDNQIHSKTEFPLYGMIIIYSFISKYMIQKFI